MLNGRTREDFEGLMAAACYEPLMPEEQSALDAYLAANPAALEEFEALKAFTRAIPKDNPAFTGDLLPALKQELADLGVPPGTVPGPARWFGWRPAMALVAAAVAIVALLQLQLPGANEGGGEEQIQLAATTPTGIALNRVRAMLNDQDFSGAYRTIRETLASQPDDKESAGELQYLLASLEFGHFQQYDRAHEAYETLRNEYWDTAWRAYPQSASRLELLAEAAAEDYQPLYTIRRALDRGDAGFAELEQVLARHAESQSMIATLAVDAMREVAGGLETPGGAFEVAAYETVLRRCSNPVAIAHMNHALGEMYLTTLDDRAKAIDFFERVAACGHDKLAGSACEQLDQLAAAQ